ncbi:cytochrome c [Dyadobacter sp. CY326]|uniref:c-type cytochrome n=1 Tax=Dyadobacter sp. CY326 TaxID=2907300 RepID=UPI001F33C54D|nr:cytochrome c [Dyadobacter sp. CY326]MCE7066704.1 cytochrome c [Dyadobacter sp. CY326]
MTKSAIALLFLLSMFSCKSASELKSEQYFVEGYQLYTTNCANCHQADGKGMSNLYPPLAGSAILNDKLAVACIIKNGMKGTILVNGKEFNRPMPANPKLTEIEIAELVSFVSMKFGKDSLYTPIETVQKALASCKAY